MMCHYEQTPFIFALDSLQPDGNIKVYNAGRIKAPDGAANDIIGEAVPSSNPGAFTVSFPGAPKTNSPNCK